jgi:protein disulfide-isomerase
MRNFSTCAAMVATVLFTTSLLAERPATEGAKVGEWTMDFEAAKTLAKEKNLPVLLNFTGSDWCGWCKLMDKNVFSTDAWKTYATQNVVTVFIDFPKDKSLVPEKRAEANKALSEKMGVKGYPTYILLAPDGEKRIGKLGASKTATPESFIADIRKVIEWPAKIAKLSPADKALYDKAKAEMDVIQAEIKKWMETKPERNEENNKKFAGFMERMNACNKAISDILEK